MEGGARQGVVAMGFHHQTTDYVGDIGMKRFRRSLISKLLCLGRKMRRIGKGAAVLNFFPLK